MSGQLPAVSMAAVPGRRKTILDIAKEVEKRGFSGIWCPSMSDSMSLCVALSMVTETIPIATSIMPIYFRPAIDMAQSAAFIHEISGGRFRFGIGVSHAPAIKRMGVVAGKPLTDMRNYVRELRAAERVGELPPLVLATLRKKMIGLAGEIGDGMVFANGSRSHMRESLSVLTEEQRQADDFYIANMIPTCIDDDVQAAAAVNRRTLTGYVQLPNYRNYWKEAGYVEEMEAVEDAVAKKEFDRIPECMSEKWLSDVTLYGPANHIREQVEAWFDVGIKTPILVPSSAQGNQLKAFEQLFDLYS